MHVANKIFVRYTKKWLLLIVLAYYYLTPSKVNGNEQMYGRTL